MGHHLVSLGSSEETFWRFIGSGGLITVGLGLPRPSQPPARGRGFVIVRFCSVRRNWDQLPSGAFQSPRCLDECIRMGEVDNVGHNADYVVQN